jgi:hypothetical protein
VPASPAPHPAASRPTRPPPPHHPHLSTLLANAENRHWHALAPVPCPARELWLHPPPHRQWAPLQTRHLITGSDVTLLHQRAHTHTLSLFLLITLTITHTHTHLITLLLCHAAKPALHPAKTRTRGHLSPSLCSTPTHYISLLRTCALSRYIPPPLPCSCDLPVSIYRHVYIPSCAPASSGKSAASPARGATSVSKAT